MVTRTAEASLLVELQELLIAAERRSRRLHDILGGQLVVDPRALHIVNRLVREEHELDHKRRGHVQSG